MALRLNKVNLIKKQKKNNLKTNHFCNYECGFSVRALFGSVGPITSRQPSIAFCLDNTKTATSSL